MFRRRALLAAALLALAALFFVWRSSGRAPVADGGGSKILPSSKRPGISAPAMPSPAPSGAPIQLNRASSSRDTAESSGLFEGRVVSSATGKGVPQAEITFEHASGAMSVRTAKDGSFEFQPPRLGQYRLAAILARDYLPFAPEWGRSPVTLTARAGERIRDIVLFLTPAVEYLGIVLDPHGERAAGARITLLDASQGQMELAPLQDMFTADARGEFRFRAPAWAWLEARHPAFSPGRARVDASAQASQRLELRLSDKEETEADEVLAGQVVDPKGAPVSGAAVSARRRRRAPAWEARFPQAKSDADGRFVIEHLANGKYDVTATYPGYAAGRMESVQVGTRSLVLQLAAGARLRGTVKDRATKTPVVAFTVSIQRARGPLERDTLSTDAFMDAQGHYEVSGLAPGSYTAIAAGYGYAPSAEFQFTISAALDEQTAHFELERGGELVGIVSDAKTTLALAGAQVEVEGQLSAASSIPILASAITDASGQFELHGLASGLGSILATADRHHSRIIAGLRFENGQRVGPLKIALNPTAEGEQPRMELEGIGAVLTARRDALVISNVMPGSGAAEAGLQLGDEIVSVDGHPVVELGFNGAVQRIRGPEGSCVPLSIRKADDSQVTEMVVCRRRVQG